MGNIVIPIARTADLDVEAKFEDLRVPFVQGDAGAHRFDITCSRSGVPADLSSATCLGQFVNAAGQTIELEGTVSGNVASVEVDGSCYAVQGKLLVLISVAYNGDVVTVYYGRVHVASGPTDIIVDPDDFVPSITELLAQIAQCAQATSDAYDAADAANAAAAGIAAAIDAEMAEVQAQIDADFDVMQDEIDEAKQDIADGLAVVDGAVAGVDAAVDAAISAITTNGYVSGGEVQAQDTPDQTVLVPFHIIISPGGVRRIVPEVSALAAVAADATFPRIDIVYDTEEGVPTYLAGTAAASPSQPATPSGGTLSALISRPANDNTIAAGDITDARVFLHAFQSTGEVNAMWHGAVGDGVANDTRAINAAINQTEAGQRLYLPAGDYLVDSPIVIAKAISVVMDGTIIYGGTDNIAVLTITPGSGAVFSGLRHVLRASRSVVSDWSSRASVSIKLVNHQECDITIMKAANSTIGVHCLSDAAGHVYNKYSLEAITNNKYNVEIDAINSGWTNENVFLLGRFSVFSGINPTVSRYGVHVHTSDGSYEYCNNNHFYKPAFEMIAPTPPAEVLPVLIDDGIFNYFWECRNECDGNCVMRDNGHQQNHMTEGYGAIGHYIENGSPQYTGSTFKRLGDFDLMKDAVPYKVFDSGLISNRASVYDETGWAGHYKIAVPGMAFASDSTGAITRDAWGVIHDGYISQNATYIGVFLKADNAKRFLVSRELSVTGSGLRVLVQTYDADMQIIDGSVTRYLKSVDGRGLSWNASVNGYMSGSDSASDYFFELADDVKYIFVGSNDSLRSMSVYADKVVAAYSPYDRLEDDSYALAAPATFGTFLQGRRLINAAPAVGAAKLWVCMVSGTFDTINTTCAADDTEVVVVASATGLEVGQFVLINAVTKTRIAKIDGTNITMEDAVPAGSGLTFVNASAGWESIGEDIGSEEPTVYYLALATGPIFKRGRYSGTSGWGGHDAVYIPGLYHLALSDGSVARGRWGVLNHNYAEFAGSYVGALFNAKEAKNFYVLREYHNISADPDAVCVRAYDADMNILDGTSTAYVTGVGETAFNWSATISAYALDGGDFANETVEFSLHDDVKYVFIGVTGTFRSFSVFADAPICAYSPYDRASDPNVAVGAPIVGTHEVGDALMALTPAVSSPKGWVCTVAGTDDAISTTCTADDSAVVVVADATGLDVGMYIKINGGAAKRIVKIDGTSITMDSAVTAGSGLTFVNSASTWVSVGNL